MRDAFYDAIRIFDLAQVYRVRKSDFVYTVLANMFAWPKTADGYKIPEAQNNPPPTGGGTGMTYQFLRLGFENYEVSGRL